VTIDDKKLRTIAALLAKGNDKAATDAEAEAYLAKATELMVKHGIDEAQLSAASSGAQVENITSYPLVFEGVYAPEFMHMAHLVANALGLQSYQVAGGQRTRSGRRLYVVGFENDVQLVRVLVTSLNIQGTNAVEKFVDNIKMKTPYVWNSYSGGDKYKRRRAFILGFGKSVAARIEATRKQVIQESGHGAEVAIRGREVTVRQWLESNVPGLRQSSVTRRYGVDAQQAGMRAGEQADIGGKKVSVHTGHRAIGS
jgi:hypothetical protein